MRISREQLEWSSGLFEGIPAFILGNGPTLPLDLECLDGFFTVGVNRILKVYDPVVLMWYDTNVYREMRAEFAKSTALKLSSYRLSRIGQTIGIRTVGNMENPHEDLPPNPGYIGVTGSSGVSAAYWARRLGCDPVHLLGMSATVIDGKTDFYGDNKYHNTDTLGIIDARTRVLLQNDWAVPVATQEEVDELANHHRFTIRPRDEYLRIIGGVRPRQRAKLTRRASTSAERAVHRGGEPDNPVGICPQCSYMGRFDRLHGQCPTD